MFTGCEGCANFGKTEFLGNEIEGCLVDMIDPQKCVLNKHHQTEQQNKGLRKQNQELQQAFLEILKMCNEPADNIPVVEFQDRIKAVLNGKA